MSLFFKTRVFLDRRTGRYDHSMIAVIIIDTVRIYDFSLIYRLQQGPDSQKSQVSNILTQANFSSNRKQIKSIPKLKQRRLC